MKIFCDALAAAVNPAQSTTNASSIFDIVRRGNQYGTHQQRLIPSVKVHFTVM